MLPCFKRKKSDENSVVIGDEAPLLPTSLIYTSILHTLKCHRGLGNGSSNNVRVPVGLQFLARCLLNNFERLGNSDNNLYKDFDEENSKAANNDDDMSDGDDKNGLSCPDVTKLFLNELTSASYTMRFGARLFLETTLASGDDNFDGDIKKILFDRGVASLKVTEQIGIVEAVGYLVNKNNKNNSSSLSPVSFFETDEKTTNGDFTKLLDSILTINKEFDDVIRKEDLKIGAGGLHPPTSTNMKSGKDENKKDSQEVSERNER